jgi:hypothetical protein
VRCRAFETNDASFEAGDSAKAEDAVDVGRVQLLVELSQIASDRCGELKSVASQSPKLIPMTPEPLVGFRCAEVRFDSRQTPSDLADPSAAHAEATGNLTIAVPGVEQLSDTTCLVDEVRSQ